MELPDVVVLIREYSKPHVRTGTLIINFRTFHFMVGHSYVSLQFHGVISLLLFGMVIISIEMFIIFLLN